MIKRPAFLVSPVIIMGIAVVYSLNTLISGLGSFVAQAVLLLFVATPFSLLHRREVGLHPALNVLLGLLVFVCTQTCFEQVVLAAFAVHGTQPFEWGCNAFGAVQLSLYFGVHAFLSATLRQPDSASAQRCC